MSRVHLLAAVTSVLMGGLAMGGTWDAELARTQSGQPRLVVFEFFDSPCPTCVEAGLVVDALAQRYEQARRPVLFIEYRSADRLGNRLDRWYDACPDWRQCFLPLELVDSGWRWSCGPKDFYAVYTSFIDQALAHPPGADLTATYTRAGSDLTVRLEVVNRSGVTLGADNDATLNVIVYEHARVLNTGRFARAAAELPIDTPLPDGARADFQLQLTDVPVAEWERAVVVVLLDRRPADAPERYESLQAATAVDALLPTVTPAPSPTVTPTPEWLAPPLLMPVALRAALP